MRNDADNNFAERLLDESAAARILNLSPRTLQAWRQSGEGPAFCRFGSAVRYSHADLAEFVNNRRVVGATGAAAKKGDLE